MTAVLSIVAFALGSIMGGQLLGALRHTDLREQGSGNLGATNALRSGGVGFGLGVLAIDATKGFAAALLPTLAGSSAPALPWVCGAAAILGHVFSPWARFRGGKGVATLAGVYLALAPQALGWGLAGFGIALAVSGVASLATFALITIAAFQVVCISDAGFFSPAGYFAVAAVPFVLWTHRANLQRLAQGTEPRFRLPRTP